MGICAYANMTTTSSLKIPLKEAGAASLNRIGLLENLLGTVPSPITHQHDLKGRFSVPSDRLERGLESIHIPLATAHQVGNDIFPLFLP